jgi:hypothetical protein
MNITGHGEEEVYGGGSASNFFCKKWGMQGVVVLLYLSVP